MDIPILHMQLHWTHIIDSPATKAAELVAVPAEAADHIAYVMGDD